MTAFRSTWLALIPFWVVACAPESPLSGAGRPTVAMCPAEQLEGDYFGGQLTQTPAQAASVREFTAALRRVNEPPLYCGRSDAGEEYRLLRLGTNGVAAVVRVWRRADSHGIVAQTLETTRERSSSTGRSEAELTPEEWLRIVPTLEGTGLWRPPPSLPPLPTGRYSEYFGGRYIIEGRKDHMYRAFEGGSEQLTAADAALAEIVASKVKVHDGDLWSPLRHRTGWLLMGMLDMRTGKWGTFQNQLIRTPVDADTARILPRVGDVLEVVRPAELIISGFGLYGERDRLTSPGRRAFEETDRIPLVLPPGTRVVVRDVDEEETSPEDFRDYWVRVEPQ